MEEFYREKFFKKYFLGESVEFRKYKINPLYFFFNGSVEPIFYNREYDEDDRLEYLDFHHKVDFIDILLKLDDERPGNPLMGLLHWIVFDERKYYFTKTLIKHGLDCNAIIQKSIYFGKSNKILKYVSNYEYDITHLLRTNISQHIKQRLDFYQYMTKNKRLFNVLPSQEDNYALNRENFDEFKNVFKGGLIKSDKQFNNLLFFALSEKNIDYFYYMFFRKGNFKIDFESLLTFKNKKIRKIIIIDMKYWNN